jgi:hypothetical protein
MTNEQNHGGPCENTDREIWRMYPDSYYSPSIHVTVNGRIGMNVAGHVIVMPIERWYELAKASLAVEPKAEVCGARITDMHTCARPSGHAGAHRADGFPYAIQQPACEDGHAWQWLDITNGVCVCSICGASR